MTYLYCFGVGSHYVQILILLPVVIERISNGLADELAVLLQCVQCVLHCLVYGLLYGATHVLDLIDTSTGLWTKRIKTIRRDSGIVDEVL